MTELSLKTNKQNSVFVKLESLIIYFFGFFFLRQEKKKKKKRQPLGTFRFLS